MRPHKEIPVVQQTQETKGKCEQETLWFLQEKIGKAGFRTG